MWNAVRDPGLLSGRRHIFLPWALGFFRDCHTDRSVLDYGGARRQLRGLSRFPEIGAKTEKKPLLFFLSKGGAGRHPVLCRAGYPAKAVQSLHQ